MTKDELLIIRTLIEKDDRIDELETVLLEIKAFMLNIKELEEGDYNFIMAEIERVMNNEKDNI